MIMMALKQSNFIITSIIIACTFIPFSQLSGADRLKKIPLAKNISVATCDKLDITADGKVSFIPIKTEEYLLPSRMHFAGASEGILYLYNNDYIISIDERTGTITQKIDRKGNGPEEYITILSASIDTKEKTIIIYDPQKNKIIKYDYYGKFIGVQKFEENGTVVVMPDGNYIICYKPYSSKQNLYGIYDSEGKLIRESKSKRVDGRSRIIAYNMAQNFNNNSFISQTNIDTLTCISSSNEYPMIYMDLGKYHMPDKYRKSIELMNNNIDRYISISDLNIVKEYLFIGYHYDKKLYRDIWNINKSELLSRSILEKSDDRFGFPVKVNGTIVYCWCDFTHNNSLYCILPHWESVKVFPNIKEEDNPVLMKITF